MSVGERLPKTLPAALAQILRSSESESESESSESESSSTYSDYSDYDDYSYSDYDSYSDYSEEEDEPQPLARNAFAKRRVLAGIEPTPVQPTEPEEKAQHAQHAGPAEGEGEKKTSWRMPEEVKETLTKEAFDKVAEGQETVDVVAVKSIVAGKGMNEAVVNEVSVQGCGLSRRCALVTDAPTLSRLEFAVVVFVLKKIQQGAAVPKHLPLPLRSLLPRRAVTAPPVRRVWEITEKKEKELTALWERACKGKETVSVKTARTELGQICKNPATCRQMWEFRCEVRGSLNLVASDRETLTQKEFVVALFMAQVQITKRLEE